MKISEKGLTLAVVPIFLVLVLALSLSCRDSQWEDDGDSRGVLPPGNHGIAALPLYLGQSSLEEAISASQVIVRARLQSVSAGTERWQPGVIDTPPHDSISYIGTMEHMFAALEYLKGTGDGTLIAVVTTEPRSYGYESTGDALAAATAFLSDRDSQWDGREAIIFLTTHLNLLPDFPRDGYYLLGQIGDDFGIYGDYYTIASPHDKRWLPEALGALGASRSGDSKRFLLDAPSSNGVRGASGSSGTITLTSMKAKIGEFEQEVAAGDGSDAYRECLYAKARAERRVEERTQGFKRPQFNHHKSIDSGLPGGTLLYPDDFTGDRTPRPPDRRVMEIRGEDADLFVAHNSEVVDTARPLPAGEYRFYEEWIDTNLIPCDGEPEEMERDVDIIVTVTTPEGVVHEALFDPVSSGDSTGYHGTGDALSDTDFTLADGTEISIESLVHESGRLTLGLSPFNALTGHTLDFITVDGTSALTLNASAAAVNAEYGTLTWAVSDQPWTSVDKLMLRISEPEPLRAEFRRAPFSHNGRTAFTIRLRFNAPVAGLDATTVQSALEVENGRITRARTVNPDQTHLWELRVQPARGGLLTITLPSSRNCMSTPVICDGGERPVSEAVILRVQGSVRDE